MWDCRLRIFWHLLFETMEYGISIWFQFYFWRNCWPWRCRSPTTAPCQETRIWVECRDFWNLAPFSVWICSEFLFYLLHWGIEKVSRKFNHLDSLELHPYLVILPWPWLASEMTVRLYLLCPWVSACPSSPISLICLCQCLWNAVSCLRMWLSCQRHAAPLPPTPLISTSPRIIQKTTKTKSPSESTL